MAKKTESKNIVLYYAVEHINEIIELIDKKTSVYVKYQKLTRLPVKVVINWQLAYILMLIEHRRIFIKYVRDVKET